MARVGICDSHQIAMAGLSSTLTEHGLEVVATAYDRKQGLGLAAASAGLVVLVDIDLRGGDRAAGDVIERCWPPAGSRSRPESAVSRRYSCGRFATARGDT